eukprot:4890422-Pleurochrysis_carterae.AAC.1
MQAHAQLHTHSRTHSRTRMHSRAHKFHRPVWHALTAFGHICTDSRVRVGFMLASLERRKHGSGSSKAETGAPQRLKASFGLMKSVG